jgi:hypothetical protein
MAWVLCAGVLALVSACGSEVAERVSPTPSAVTSAERKELLELAVSADQLPPLNRTSASLTSDDVVAQADLPDLRETLESAGFRGGLKLEYRGVSPRLTGVESQVLAFTLDSGAAEFGEYLAEHAGAFFGEPITVAPIVLEGREAWRFDPPVCDCAGAQPLSAGAVQNGSKLVILQITGPEADAVMLKRLLATALGPTT